VRRGTRRARLIRLARGSGAVVGALDPQTIAATADQSRGGISELFRRPPRDLQRLTPGRRTGGMRIDREIGSIGGIEAPLTEPPFSAPRPPLVAAPPPPPPAPQCVPTPPCPPGATRNVPALSQAVTRLPL